MRPYTPVSSLPGTAVILAGIILLILVSVPVTADPYFSPDEGKYPLTVQFTLPGGENGDRVTWSFGDGNTSTEVSPKFTYKKMGAYTPECTVILPGATVTYFFDKISVKNADMSDSDTYDSHWPYEKEVIAETDGLSYDELIRQGDGLLALDLASYAVKAYKKAIEMNGSDPLLIGKYAQNLVSLGQLNEAKNAYNQSVTANPDPEIMTAFGYLLITMNEYEEAREIFTRALSIDAQNTAALTGLGDALALLGQPEEAAKTYGNALSISSQLPVTQKAYGDVLITLGEYDKAVSAYKKAMDLGVNGSEIWYSYATALQKTGQDSEAENARTTARSLIKPLNIARGPSGIPTCNIGAMG